MRKTAAECSAAVFRLRERKGENDSGYCHSVLKKAYASPRSLPISRQIMMASATVMRLIAVAIIKDWPQIAEIATPPNTETNATIRNRTWIIEFFIMIISSKSLSFSFVFFVFCCFARGFLILTII